MRESRRKLGAVLVGVVEEPLLEWVFRRTIVLCAIETRLWLARTTTG